jgi:hypothetical protein
MVLITVRMAFCHIRHDPRAAGVPATHASHPEPAGISRIRRPVAVTQWHDEADRRVGHDTAMGQQARTDENSEPLSTDELEVVVAREAREGRSRAMIRT